jgi:N-acetylmuramic acid 6-phosphate etherase
MNSTGPTGDRPAVRVESPTERRNERTTQIDQVSTAELLALINAEDATVAAAVAAAHGELARLVDGAVQSIRNGGRLHYVGAGTSGRMAVLDAAELAPTYGIDERWVIAHHAGGDAALRAAVEGVEDDADAGAYDLGAVRPDDVVVGIAASGRTPYVAGALRAARDVGATTALITSNPQPPLAELADLLVVADTGPEVIAGSTRMKAATAQKLILNSLSTAVAVRLGRTWSNLMVDVVATNAKLRGRSLVLLEQATGRSVDKCRRALDSADGELKTALVSLLADCPKEDARVALAAAHGDVRAAVDAADTNRQQTS